MRLALITPSFSRDFALCAELCRSIDTHDRDGLEHVLVVPKGDVGLFQTLAREGRRVVAQEEVLPSSLVSVPLPSVVAIPGVFRKRLRKIWLTPGLDVVRGWVLQQVLKMSADRLTDAEGYVFIDSDVEIVRPFGTDTFVRDGRLPMHRVENAVSPDTQPHAGWQDVACDLIGIERFPFEGDSLVSTLMCWRRDRLKDLQARIAEVGGADYRRVLLRQKSLSEYVVYSVYCRHAVAGEHGHFLQDSAICLEDWCFDLATDDGMREFVHGLEDHHVAVLMQSTNEWPIEKRRATVKAIREAAGLA